MDQDRTSIFELASRVFDGWIDPDTGLRVLKIIPHNDDLVNDDGEPLRLHTVYHQMPCFLDGGRRVLLRRRGTVRREPGRREPGLGKWRGGSGLMDLTSGELSRPFPTGYFVSEVCDKTNLAVLRGRHGECLEVIIWDIAAGQAVANYVLPEGWKSNEARILSDGRRAIIQQYVGKFYDEKVHSQFCLIDLAGNCERILEADGFFCNHIQSCPTDPELIAYDRWPSPKRPTDVVIHLRYLDGSFEQPLPQLESTVRPGPHWGGQRDHYLWTPDGQRIASYFMPEDSDSDNHFDFDWWISVMDWRSGVDFCAPYPPERWGCHFQISPDSRYIVSAGGWNFQCIYRIDIEALKNGWNERVLCTYPHTEEDPKSSELFHQPHVLPDGSGVIFSAGWPGPEAGVYLVEWPDEEWASA